MNMAASPTQKYKPTSKGWPCPICGNVSGFCKSREGDRGDLLLYCHNEPTKPNGPINGHHWTATVGTWGVFSTEKPKHQGQSTRTKAPIRTPQPLPSTDERAAAFRSFMGNLTLHPADRADLHGRGVTDAQIEGWGVLSIEGKEPGYLVPCYSPNGAIVGAQWRLRNPGDGARYKWVSWLGGGSKNGEELPLTVHRPIGVEPVGIAVCEGIGAKSFVLAQNTEMVTIGAGSDSQFISSPDHWRSYLAALTDELKTTNVTLYPDAGAVLNASVMGKYSQWFKAIAELGYTVDVAWWGQSVKGESPDPDELTDDVDVKLISVEEFEALAKPVKEIPWKCLSSHLDQVGSWKSQDLGKNSAEMAKVAELIEEMKVNPNIKYMGTRTAQPNGSQDAHDLHTFSVFEPQLNLDFAITKMIESPDGGLLELKTRQRQGDRLVTRTVLIKSTATTKVDKFIDDLKCSLGHNVVCTLKPNSLQALLQNRTAMYQIAGGRTFRLAPRTGRQDDGFWIFEGIQFNPKGLPCTADESRWLFNRDLGIDEQVVSPQIAPQSDEALSNLVNAAKKYYHPDIFPLALVTMGYGAMTAHRSEIMGDYGAIPQLNAFGDAGGGKTLAATMACAMFGTHLAPITRFSESVIFETVKSVGSLLLLVDDPLKKERRGGDLGAKVDNFTWDMYGGAARKVRGNEQKPQTNVVITSNKAIGEGTQAIESRLIKINFPVCPFNQLERPNLSSAIAKATGGLGKIIGLEYQPEAIREIARKLTPHLTGAHARLTDNYALLVHYTDRLCALAGFEFDTLAFCIKSLCPQANQFDSNKDSLTDFLEKLATMRSEGVIGEWNMTQVVKGSKPYLALQLQSIWPIFDSRYQVNYSRQSIESSIRDRGGLTGDNQRYVKSKDVWKEYERAVNQFEMGTGRLGPDDDLVKPEKPRKSAVSKSVLIPSAVIDKTIGTIEKPIDGAIDCNYSGYSSSAWEPIVVPVDEPTINPEEIQPGTIATMKIDRTEQGFTMGDTVTISATQQDSSTGRWFAVIAKDADGKNPISVWFDELDFKL